MASFPGLPGKLAYTVIKLESWILMKQVMMGWQRHQVDHMQIICTLLCTDNHASTASVSLLQAICSYAVPETQPTLSKH